MIKIKKKALFVMPQKYIKNFITDFYINLFTIINQIFETKLLSSCLFDPSSIRESVVFIISLSHWEEEEQKKILSIPKNKKIVLWHDDMFFKSKKEISITNNIFEKTNIIINANKNAFELLWPDYIEKSFWIPLFASPCFFKTINKNAKNKCLLSGQLKATHYPLRNFINQSSSKYIEKLKHPNYENPNVKSIGENYAKIINSFFTCVTDSGRTYGSLKYKISGEPRSFDIDNYLLSKNMNIKKFKNCGQVLLKIFEIQASGSLLLTDSHSPEIYLLGYKNMINYVQINEKNAIETIEDCCKNPDKYEDIRKQGWVLSKKHTMEEREKTWRNAIDERL